MKDPKLKPCPFCKEDKAVFTIFTKNASTDTEVMTGVQGWVECTACGVKGAPELRCFNAFTPVFAEARPMIIHDLKCKLAEWWNLRTDNATAEQ